MSETTSKFEGWALVEIMGHQRVAGYVTTEAFGSVVMFRVVMPEVPETEQTLERDQWVDGERAPAGSKVRIGRRRIETLIGAASVYRMTPCTEQEAMRAQPAKVELIEKAIALIAPLDDEDPEEDGEHDVDDIGF